MTTDAIQLLRDHWGDVPDADDAHVRQAYAYAIRRRRVTHIRAFSRPAFFAVALAMLAGAAFGIDHVLQNGRSPASTQLGEPGAIHDSSVIGVNPFGAAGETITLDQLVAAKPYPLAIPDSPLANSGNVGTVWLNTETGAAAAYWPSSGVEVMWGGIGVDYSGFPEQDIKTINGVKVILEPAGEFLSPHSVLLFPEPNGHLVALATDGSMADLIAVAQTLPVYRAG